MRKCLIAVAIALTALVVAAGGSFAFRAAPLSEHPAASARQASGVAAPASNTVITPDGSLNRSGTVFVPRTAMLGVRIGNNQNALTVGLPNSAHTAAGVVTQGGAMTYSSADNTTDTVTPTAHGIQFLKVLDNASAPKAFSYPISIPVGGRLALATNGPDGQNRSKVAALIFNAKGAVISTVALPWAHDATGKPLATYFTVKGTVLTQHVTFQSSAVTYPVVADPYFVWYKLGVVITMSYADMQYLAAGGITAANTLLAGGLVSGVGAIPGAALSGMLLAVTGGAAWGVATHECFWFWLPYPLVWDLPSHGYYSC